MSAMSIADLATLIRANPNRVRETCIKHGWQFDAQGRVHLPPGRIAYDCFIQECRHMPLIAGMRCIR